MSTFFVIDTNVVVAGLLMSQAGPPVARVLDGILGASFPFALSEALLAEYHAVLVRPKLAKLHGLSVAEVDAILTDLARHAIALSPVSTVASPIATDSGDQFLWDVLATQTDWVLVTGHKRSMQDKGDAADLGGQNSP